MAKAKSRGLFLSGLVVLVIGAVAARQIIVGDVAMLIANLWVRTLEAVLTLLRPLLGL